MKAKKSAERSDVKVRATEATVRASISFPTAMYRTLEDIAKEKKVSLAWIVREGMEQYIVDKWPLFKGQE